VVSGHADHPESVPIVRLLRQMWLEWHQPRTFELGAALAFSAIFSIAPVKAHHNQSSLVVPRQAIP